MNKPSNDGRAILLVVIIVAVIIALFVIMGIMYKNALLKSFDENKVETEGFKNVKTTYPTLEDVDFIENMGGSFRYDGEDGNFSGIFFDVKEGAENLYTFLSEKDDLCIRKGNYVFVIFDGAENEKLQKIIDGLSGEYVSNAK